MKVPFVDLHPMHRQLDAALHETFDRLLEDSQFIHGDDCTKFEREFAAFTGAGYCVGVANGLDAIELILRAMEIGPGDEVIVPSNTYIATAFAVSNVGARPMFVEPTIETYNIDVTRIEEAITERTKAIIAVHLQGRAADMDAVNAIAVKYGLKVVEDAAQAHGTRYKGKSVGTLSDACAWSFYPGKNIGALGDAGAVTTNDKELADRIRAIGDNGSDYKYHHIYLGVNSRLDTMQAAFLSLKLPHVEEWNDWRRAVARRYITEVTNPLIRMPLLPDDTYNHIYHVFVIRCDRRDELKEYLSSNGIGTLEHYPIPMHLQKAYSFLNIPEGTYPIAEEISRTVLSLPMYYGITDEQVSYVIEKLNAFK